MTKHPRGLSRAASIAGFPNPLFAPDDEPLALGGDLSPERLIAAYSIGIFPWYSPGEPILWWSPNPRFLLYPSNLHIPSSTLKELAKSPCTFRMDHRFKDVIAACAKIARPGQTGTWIADDMQAAYMRLHELGLAHSVECYLGDELVGGLYGVSLGRAFFGESMFYLIPEASKMAFARLLRLVFEEWKFAFVDCQMPTDHLRRFGATEVPRGKFLRDLAKSLDAPTRRGNWGNVKI